MVQLGLRYRTGDSYLANYRKEQKWGKEIFQKEVRWSKYVLR